METLKNDQATNPESGADEDALERNVIPLPVNRRVVRDRVADHDEDDDRGLRRPELGNYSSRNSKMKKASDGAAKPRIKMTAEDHERLSGLAAAAMDRMPEVAAALADELDRAQIVRDRRHAGGFVRMGCAVEFRDETTGRSQIVTLVYPREADIGQGKVSVMTPIGAALIGLSAGQSINWETRSGAIKRLSVLDVKEPELV